MIRVSIVGATGYTGGELLRYLIRHPEVRLAHLTTERYAGKPISDIHKFLKGRVAIIGEKINVATVARNSDVVFLGLPHGAAAKIAAAFLAKGARVVDLSADFRLEESAIYAKWYGGNHPVPKLLREAVYGLPERYRQKIRDARLVANPGCYATTSILAGLPLAAGGWLGKGPIIVDAKSGVSGAGKKMDEMYLYSEANESMQAYGLTGHRHHPEIWQEWSKAAKDARKKSVANDFIFVPHLAPMTRGILATLYAPLSRKMTAESLRDLYQQYYLQEPFVTILGAYESPETKAVAHTNHVQIGVSVDVTGTHAIVIAALDNLVKGASGQAIQNMNLMFGIDETTGLR